MNRLLTLVALLNAPALVLAAAPQPNIVIIVADDLGYGDLGVHGCKDIPTPHIDSIAKAGVRCTSGHVTGPYCSPTRAGLLTGRYQQRFGHEFNPGGAKAGGAKAGASGLPTTERTIADRLKAAGYVTGLVGKWHLGSAEQFHPNRRGFDEFFGFLGGAHAYFPGQGAPIYRNSEVVAEEDYLTEAIAREAASFIDRHQSRPFFLYLSFNAVHTPMHATDARLKKFSHIQDSKRRAYAAMLSAMDDGVGGTLARLRENGLEQNTLVFFLSDNGGPTMRGVSVNGSQNAPLRGSKRTTLEGGIRVPFFVRWTGKLPAGAIYDEPVIQLDILPTALAAAGISLEERPAIDGVNLLAQLSGQTDRSPHEALYWRFGKQMAIRRGDWKLVRYDTTADGAVDGGISPARLYDLANDIGERDDLAAHHPDRVKELQAAWDKWNESNVEPLWGGGARAAKRAAKRASKAG